MGRGLHLLLLILATTVQVFGQTWDAPYFLDPGGVPGVTLNPDDSAMVYFDENLPLNTRAVKLNYNGNDEPTISRFPIPPSGEAYLGPKFERGDDGFWYLEVTESQDYEASYFVGNPNYFFGISIGSINRDLNIIIINMDDNRPTMEPEVTNCRIQEGPLKDININELNCFYRIYDRDGHMANITDRITHEIHTDIEKTFRFEPTTGIPADITTQNMSMSLIPLEDLDFETTSIYVLTWLVKDTFPNETELRVVVEVTDIADTPPRWTSVFASQQFDEKEAQQYSVTATDGDIIINDNITYEVTFPGQDWRDWISIDYNSGQIDVKEIDRDALQIETYLFTVHACELNMPDQCVVQDITFLVNDLNDNAPNISVDGNDFTLTLDESTVSTINTVIVVNDIDLGVNAQYTIELMSSDEDSIMYHEAFSVAPNSGYQETRVYLFITNPDRLDYEDKEWQNFSFNLVARGIENSSHVHTVTFEVSLNNLNDESPIFVMCNENPETSSDECVVEIEETFPGLTELIVMKAEDKDIGDRVTHRLLGSYAERILTIDEDSGQIATANLDRPFDYETLQEIIIQVQATDTLVDKNGARNTAVSQLTIRLTDVNDETPIITVSSTLAAIDENLKDGVSILEGFTIQAMDDDTNADLYFEIDWDNSFALKNGADYVNFTYYRGCVEIDIDIDHGVGSPVIAKLTIVETVKDNTPDYEEFDTLHLNVIAIDRNQAVGLDRTSVTIPILINDLNDNTPEFDDSTKAEMSVRENSESGIMIAVVTATDADIGTRLTYSLTPRNGTEEGLVNIVESTGQIRVDGTTTIDADSPPLYELYYTVGASDGELTAYADIVISVVDVNDNEPAFPSTPELKVLEKSENLTHIYTFLATDQDRDVENRAVVYRFRESTINMQYRSFFSIDETSGDFIVLYESTLMLDRDQGVPQVPINMEIVASNTDQVALSAYTEVSVVLLDINDQVPQLDTTALTVSENSSDDLNDLVGTITASDGDDPETTNSHVTFTIGEIEALDRTFEESLDGLFALRDINEKERTANLYVGRNLKGYYGDFKVTIEMEDRGEIPNKSTGSLVVTVTKYNFLPPTFIFPKDNDMIYLSRTQNVDSTLMLFGDIAPLPQLSATDNQGDKFTFTFSIEDELFKLAGAGGSILQISRQPLPGELNTNKPLTITVNSDGLPAIPITNTVGIVFVDDTADPIFDVNNIDMMDKFVEEEPGNQKEFFPAAKYELEGDLDLPFLPIHYVLQDPSLPFTIPDSLVNELHLDIALDRDEEEGCCYTVVIQAGKSASPTNPNDKSLLTINIELADINDNPPLFDSEDNYAIFHSDDVSSAVIYYMTATDRDRDSVIKYLINDTNLEYAQQFPGFDLNDSTGAVSLAQQPSSAATGYAILTVEASDGEFYTHADLKIFIISRTDHIVKFVFQNTKVECETKQTEIGEVLTSFFTEQKYYYTASAKGCLDVVDDDGTPIPDQVVAEVYFINTEKNEPVPSAEIERFANDIPTFQGLAREFLREDLNLMSFSPTTEEEDNTAEVLRAWLIGVSVVLGALCVLLLVAFILKIRSLTNRLNKLSVTKYGSQESGLNRKIVPNTNRNAVQGSNPVFNTEKTVPEFDQTSIGSGDSDLVGVEDNPEFDYTPPKSNGVANSS